MIEIKDMFACGVQYGHRTAFSNPEMAQYVYTQKNGLQIIDLVQTSVMFAESLAFLDQLVRSGGRVVIVGTKQAAQTLIQKYGEEMGMPYVDHRWYAGTLTNFKTIRSSVDRLSQLDKRFKAEDFKGLTKKERLVLQRERAKLTLCLGGVKDLNALPEALFVVDVIQERIAIKEANKLGIPVIGVVDTNCSPEGIDYVIPGNDDAISAIEYYLECVSQVVKAAQADFKVAQEKVEKRNRPVIKKAAAKEEKAEVAEDAAKKVVKKKAAKEEEAESKVVKKVVKKVAKAKEETSEAEEKKPAVKKVAKKTTKAAEKKEEEAKAEPKKAVAKKPAAKAPAKKPAAKKPAAKKATTKSSDKPSTKE